MIQAQHAVHMGNAKKNENFKHLNGEYHLGGIGICGWITLKCT
jgi:hypothetical protein